jgi:hypothetical protein
MSRLAVDACLSRGRGFQESRLDSRARYAIAKSCGTLPSNLSADLEETVVTLIAPARSRPALSTRVHEPTGIQNWAAILPRRRPRADSDRGPGDNTGTGNMIKRIQETTFGNRAAPGFVLKGETARRVVGSGAGWFRTKHHLAGLPVGGRTRTSGRGSSP